ALTRKGLLPLPLSMSRSHPKIKCLADLAVGGLIDELQRERIETRQEFFGNNEEVPHVEVVPLTLTGVRPIVGKWMDPNDVSLEVQNFEAAEQMNTVSVALPLVPEVFQLDIDFRLFAWYEALAIGPG